MVLASYDKMQIDAEPEKQHTSLEKIWSECWKLKDTNEMVYATLTQVMTLFNHLWEMYFKGQKENEIYLRDLSHIQLE